MTQDAIVTRIINNDMAEVVATRTTACGSNCGNCESCIFDDKVKAEARNLINAQPGDSVVIASKSSRVFSAAMLVYVMPLVLFLAGYVIAYLCGAPEGLCVAASFLGLVLGGVILVLSHKKWKEKNPITFDIIRYAENSEEV